MKIAVVGGGPAGLFFALLMKGHSVVVFEQNPRDATFGFGVVFSRGALEFLARDEPAMHARLCAAMEHWPIQRIVHRDTAVDIDGNGFSGIARLRLLQILQQECESAGIELVFERSVSSPPEGFDLVVAADGLNSAIRGALPFRPKIKLLTNRFAWYGTSRVFDCLTLTFRQGPHGPFVAHHYRYTPAMSTFLVECEAATWERAGLDRMDDADSRAYCERIFAADLAGAPLVSNRSLWRNFPLLSNPTWSIGNTVLIGDALRTGHFSIGSGTRLAMDDAIALARAFGAVGDDVPAALAEFERQRRPVVEKLVAAANRSSYWYERLSEKMALDPWQLAYDYMTRSGRMTRERLRHEAPRFMSSLELQSGNEP
jgi:2-polyprenyl-6-methoxyphenol hydroxylase-like FAD-dependent oxidoreductase